MQRVDGEYPLLGYNHVAGTLIAQVANDTVITASGRKEGRKERGFNHGLTHARTHAHWNRPSTPRSTIHNNPSLTSYPESFTTFTIFSLWNPNCG